MDIPVITRQQSRTFKGPQRLKYGEIIGKASKDIHEANMSMNIT